MKLESSKALFAQTANRLSPLMKANVTKGHRISAQDAAASYTVKANGDRIEYSNWWVHRSLSCILDILELISSRSRSKIPDGMTSRFCSGISCMQDIGRILVVVLQPCIFQFERVWAHSLCHYQTSFNRFLGKEGI